jgi:DNA polymerase III alpha subunit (gram-positive type)
MKDMMGNKKIVIFDVETSGLYCGEDGKEPARILRVDATKIENGKLGETFSSLVACGEYINKFVRDITGISNKTLKGAPRLKTVLKQLKDFTNGYEVYTRNSEFINKFLSYYGNKNGIQIDLAKEKDYNEISKFLSQRELREYLKNSKDNETIALAKLLVKES